jgi:hypothetical protein
MPWPPLLQGVMALQNDDDVAHAEDTLRQLSAVLSQQGLLAPLELKLAGLSHFQNQVGASLPTSFFMNGTSQAQPLLYCHRAMEFQWPWAVPVLPCPGHVHPHPPACPVGMAEGCLHGIPRQSFPIINHHTLELRELRAQEGC